MSFARTSTGLLFRDQFNRANGAPGANWTVDAGGWAINGNRLETTSSGQVRLTGLATRADFLVQVTGKRTNLQIYLTVILRQSGAGGGTYYQFDIGGSGDGTDPSESRLYRKTAGGFTRLAGDYKLNPLAVSQDVRYTFSAIGTEQKGWLDGDLAVSATDATAANQANGSLTIESNQIGAGTSSVDDLVVCSSRTLTVNGLPAGYKLRCATLTSAAAVAATPLTFDLQGSALPAEIEVLDGTGAVVDAVGDVYGGDVWTYTASVVPTVNVTRSSTGLLFRDQFIRANGAPGANYSVISGTWAINANKLRAQADNNTTRDMEVVAAAIGGTRKEFYMQYYVTRANNKAWLQTNIRQNNGTRTLKYVQTIAADDAGGGQANESQWYEYNSGFSLIGRVASGAAASGTRQRITASVLGTGAPVTLRSWIDGFKSNQIADSTAANNINGAIGFSTFGQPAGPANSNVDIEDLIVCSARTITVSGLPTGYFIACAGIVAAESGGSASIDLLASQMPATLFVLDSTGAATAMFDGVFGGDAFAFSAFTSYARTGSGGVVVGGSAAFSYTTAQSYVRVGSGGVMVGGSAPFATQRHYYGTGSGGVTVGGTAPRGVGRARMGSGGVIVSGSAAPSVGRAYVGSGGVSVGGSAPALFYHQPSVTVERGRSYTGTGYTLDRDYAPTVGVPVDVIGATGVLTPREEGAVGEPKKKPPHQVPPGQVIVDSYVRRGSGGVHVGGAASATFYQGSGPPITSPTSYVIFATGGVITGGTAPFSKTAVSRYAARGSGGVHVGGTATAQYVGRLSYNRVGSGGVLARGSAPFSYTAVPSGGGGGGVAFRTPTPPLNWGPTARTKPIVTGATWNVSTVAQMNAALAGFAAGDEIVIAVGARLVSQFILPARLGAGQWVTIRTAAAIDTVCPQGRRMTPGKAATLNLGGMVTPGGGSVAFRPAAGAQGFYFIGLDISLGGSGSAATHLGNVYMKTAAEMAGRIVMDRCIARGGATYACNRAFYCCGEYIAVFDTWIADFYGSGDTQGILVMGWQGPYYFDNNHIEGWTENFMSGGAETGTPGTDVRGVPSDIVFTHNHVTKNMAYRNGAPFACTVKNLAELKSGRRIEFAYNILEFTWPQGQSTPVNFKSVDQGNTHPLQGTQDVNFHHNWIRFAGGGPTYSAHPQNPIYSINPMNRLYAHDNLWEYINTQPNFTGGGVIMQLSGDLSEVTIEHETWVVALGNGTAIVVEGDADGPIAVLNNILHAEVYGMKKSGFSSGKASWESFIPTAANRFWDKNVLIGLTGGNANAYPAGTIYKANDAAIGYANLAGRDYTVTGALATAATDGGPVGVSNFAALMTLLGPVLNG